MAVRVCRGKEALGRDAIAERIPVSFLFMGIFYPTKGNVLAPKLSVSHLTSIVRAWSFCEVFLSLNTQ